jgi:hypothetical protein
VALSQAAAEVVVDEPLVQRVLIDDDQAIVDSGDDVGVVDLDGLGANRRGD